MEGHGWGLAVFPLIAFVVAAWFGLILARRFADRRRPHEGVWAVALFMYAAASLAAFLGLVDGWSTGEYRVYWLFGAALNVPFLAQGEVYVLSRDRRLPHMLLLIVLAISALSVWVAWSEPVRQVALTESLPLGKDAWGTSSPAYQLRWLSWIGYFALLGGTAWSALKMKGLPDLRDRTTGTVLIAFGATIVAIGSGVGAGLDVVPLFAISLAAGIAVMFWGFLRASRPARQPA